MPLWPSVLVTTTSTDPAVCAGVVAVMELLLLRVTLLAAVPPSVTLAPDWNPVPVIVTDVPPAVVPEVGDIKLTVGAGVELCPLARNAAACITQGDELVVAVAL